MLALAVAAVLVVAGVVWVKITHTEPSYDAFGWLTWGRQALLHWNLNTDGAPSWKPLTFLFTFPYAAFGSAQLSLWTVTASTAAIAAGVFAARIAYRLTGLSDARGARRWPALVAGAFAGVGVLGMNYLSHQVLIATSDPMVVTLCLAAIDAHLSRHCRLAFALLVLASLGRPEAWLFTGLYAIWCWSKLSGIATRAVVVAGLLLIPAGWFVIPALTSHSWFISGQLALKFAGAVHGNKLVGVTDRLLGLYELPMRIAALAAIGLAALRRDRTALLLAGAAVGWVGVEIAFAYHGWPASQRYLMEAGAVFVVLAGGAVGQALDFAARGVRAGLVPARLLRSGAADIALRAAALVAVGVLAVALVPVERSRASLLDDEIDKAKVAALRIDRLQTTIALLGGAAPIKRCGDPVTVVGFQSTLAWSIGMNVGKVGYLPGREIRSHKPIVLFRPVGTGWQVRPIHTRRALADFCRRLVLAYDAPAIRGRPDSIGAPRLLRRLFEPSPDKHRRVRERDRRRRSARRVPARRRSARPVPARRRSGRRPRAHR
jgi:hypothetical protein